MSEFTLGGYMQKHERAAAFGGSDGRAYSVAIYVDDEPDVRGLYGAALLFVCWSPGGERPVGHVETEPLAWGRTPEEATERIGVDLALRREGRARRGDRTSTGGVVAPVLGTVLERDGSAYRVATEGAEVRAVLRGKVKLGTSKVVVGDVVRLEADPGGELHGIIGIEPRRTVLERRVPEGRGVRPIAANVDQVFVVTATRTPDPIPQLIDRLLVLAEADGIAAAVVLNKVDLDPGTALAERCRRAGYPVYPTSVKTGEGMDSFKAALAGRASVVTGPSGAGKSSLLNARAAGAQAPDRRGQPPDPARDAIPRSRR